MPVRQIPNNYGSVTGVLTNPKTQTEVSPKCVYGRL